MSHEPLDPEIRSTLHDHVEDFVNAVPFDDAWEREPNLTRAPSHGGAHHLEVTRLCVRAVFAEPHLGQL